jgi:hypothetical protein
LRVEAEDVAIPPPLPLLASLVRDRVSLDDATMDASTKAVLTAPQRRRATPIPFVRVSVPEPYEHRQAMPLSLLEEWRTPEADGTLPSVRQLK